MVTAEVALAMPILVVVLTAAVWALACVGAQLRCVDAAAMAARLAARGQPVTGAVRELGPARSSVRVTRHGREVAVVVQAVVRPFGRFLHLPEVTVQAHSFTVVESPP